MTNEMKPVRCGCGGWPVICIRGKDMYWQPCGLYEVHCQDCGLNTKRYDTEAEAITAWNRAMSGVAKNATTERSVQECAENARCNERTAKVTTVEKPIEGSVRTISVMACENCENVVSIFDSYCPGCGARLEWK